MTRLQANWHLAVIRGTEFNLDKVEIHEEELDSFSRGWPEYEDLDYGAIQLPSTAVRYGKGFSYIYSRFTYRWLSASSQEGDK